jgi:hypothetical protein
MTTREFWAYIEHDRTLKRRLAVLIWTIVFAVSVIVASMIYWPPVR